MLLRRFLLVRDQDVSGISGTGVVCEGVEFSNGRVAIQWTTQFASFGLYESMADIEHIHGHDGATRVQWLDEGLT